MDGCMKKMLFLFVLPLLMGIGIGCSSRQGPVASGPPQEDAGKWGIEDPVSATSTEAQGPLYTTYNIWYEKPERIYCVNYPRGAMIPAGTAVSSAQVRGREIFFTANGTSYRLDFNPRFHPGVSSQEFLSRMVTTKTFDELTEDLRPEEVEAIEEGVLVVDMSKKAVILSRGFPCEHRTPSTDSNQWIYWENRFMTKEVNFDENGRTTRGPSTGDDLL